MPAVSGEETDRKSVRAMVDVRQGVGVRLGC